HAVRLVLGFVEIDSKFDHAGAEGTHGRVLVGRVALRHDERRAHATALRPEDRRATAPARARIAYRLAVIAARGGHHARTIRLLAPQPVEIHQTTAHLESSRGRVILVLDPYLAAGALAQFRPGVLRCRWDQWPQHFGRTLKLLKSYRLHRRILADGHRRVCRAASGAICENVRGRISHRDLRSVD